MILLIVALTKQSCPFIYVNDGVSDQFVGEIYSGAIYPSLERHDYLPLPAKKVDLVPLKKADPAPLKEPGRLIFGIPAGD